MKKALITGVTGQDGAYLSELLLQKGYDVYALVRRSSTDPFERIPDIAIDRKMKILYGNLRDSASIARALETSKPDEIYNLAAQSDVGISFKCPEETFEINYYGVGRLVNEAMKIVPDARIYQASTSEMFGSTPPPQNEESPFQPVSPYAESKLKAHQDFVVGYRERHGLFICSGILFNHESPRRGKHFVTRKVTHSLSKIKLGLQDSFALGNLNARRDWGFAKDYVKAMWLMLQQDKPEDFVISTGVNHSVRDLVDVAARALEMKITWEGEGEKEVGKDANGKVIVHIDKEFYRPREVDDLRGDSSKALELLDWKAETTFEELITMMAKNDLERVSLENKIKNLSR